MSGPWAAHRWRLALTLQQLRREVRQLAADLRAVAWCRLRRRHFIEPDALGVLRDGAALAHDWCSICGWCVNCRSLRRDLVAALERDEAAHPEEVLP